MIKIDDKNLVALLDEDPEQGIRLLEEQYIEQLRLVASRRLNSPDDVQECVQDVLSDFYLQRNLFDCAKGSLLGYLTTMVDRRAIRKYWEHQRQWRVTEVVEHPLPEIDRWERTAFLYEALEKLPEKDRQMLEWKYFYGHTAKEIAAMLDLEHETVKKRLQRGLKKLLRLMED